MPGTNRNVGAWLHAGTHPASHLLQTTRPQGAPALGPFLGPLAKGTGRKHKVGTGWSRTVSSHIRKQLETVVSPKSKLPEPIKKSKATWVEPKFFPDVEYRDITPDGLLRASLLKGLTKGEK
ncbi:hypothetical protein ACFIOY_28830 [Bradyrhizobium sp. TZ2]